jgi:ankyrin repeat protein/beta-lactamase regulating signal transducer with metallopeptidase domain
MIMHAPAWMPDWTERLGWVLVHFLWQGALIGGLAWVGSVLLGRAPAQARYLVYCAALLGCLLAPCLTWIDSGVNQPVSFSLPAKVSAAVSNPAPVFKVSAATPAVQAIVSPVIAAPDLVWNNENISPSIDTAIPYLVPLWIFGVTILALRLVFDWVHLRRICGSSSPVQNSAWFARLQALADRMGVRRAVLLWESARVEVPTVIGWLKPVLIVPATFLSALPPGQIEAILAHELAHIRRHDYLVNLGQIVIETLLFYHPAVWWISRAIRQEREHCCDDLALQIVGDKLVYASALAALEESRSLPMAITLAATGGSLLRRIERLLMGDRAVTGTASRRPVLVALALLLLLLAALSWGIFTLERAMADARLIALLEQGKGWVGNDFKHEVERSSSRINHLFDPQGNSLLHIAAEKGLDNEALLLLLAGADPNLVDASGKTPLYFTTHHPNHHQTLIRDMLLLRGAKVNVADHDGASPLKLAIEADDWNSVAMLLRWGAFEIPTAQQQQIVKLAEARNNAKILDELRTYVAEPTKAQLTHGAPAQSIQDAFVIAATKGDLATMKTLLLQQGATLDGRATDGVPAIHRAISYQQEHALVYLLQLGADPNIRDDRGYPPLSYTFGWHGQTSDEMQMALIAAGARTDLVQPTGYNLLADAVSHDNGHAIQWMIWTGNDPSKACPAGTPMHLASKEGLDSAVTLLQRNDVTEPPYTDADPKWQMMRAVKAGDLAKVQEMLDHGTPVDLELNNSGDNGLMLAIAYRQLTVARFLLKHGANPNYQNHSGDNPLRVSVGWNYEDNEKFREELLEAGANPNLRDQAGTTPFIAACVYGDLNPKITQMMAHGANINERDKSGHTGLYYAEQSGRTAAAEYLRSHGADENGSNLIASPATTTKTNPPAGAPVPTKITIIHLQDADGSPLAGAFVKADGPDISAEITSDASGAATIPLAQDRPKYLGVHVRKDGYVPKLITWNMEQPSFHLPGDFTLKMEKAQTIGGIVRNDDGQPVANANVVLIIRGSSMGGVAQQVFNDIWERRVVTDADGKWHFDEAPTDLRPLSVKLEHPDYVSNEEIDSRPADDDFRQQKAVLILHKGVVVDGDVTDESGKPVAGVDVVYGEAGSGSTTVPNTTTDAAGHFHFGGISRRGNFGLPPILTLTSPDHAPEMIDLTGFTGQPLKIVLKAGQPLRIRFTDPHGQPVKGVILAADHWRNHRPFFGTRFESDADGNIVWQHAPDDAITYAMLTDSFQSRNLELKPQAGVQTIQLRHQTVVTGRVLDAATKRPITTYDLIFGTYFPDHHPFWSAWARGAALHIAGDSYRYVFDDPAEMGSPGAGRPATEGFHRIRIEAPGYEPGVSRPIANDEEAVALDFELKPAPPVHGVVRAADGTPVKNAQVVVSGPGNALQINEGVCRDKWDQQIVTTNERGEYDLPPQEENCPIAIIQPDAGYLTTTYDDLKKSPNVTLLTWGELDIATGAASTSGPGMYVRYAHDDEDAAQKERIRFFTYKPTETRDGLTIYRHLVAGSIRVGQFGQGLDDGDLVSIVNGQTAQFDFKTGAPAVITKNATPGLPAALQTATLIVHVINSEGKPVAGATVKPIGMRTKEDPGSSWSVRAQSNAPDSTTDAQGNAPITFPAHLMDTLTVGAVSVLVRHPDASPAVAELNVDAPRPVTLVRGTSFSFSAQPVPGVRFTEVYADISGDQQTASFLGWTHSADSQSITAHFPEGNFLLRLVGVTATGKLYFSESSMFSPADFLKVLHDPKVFNRTISDNLVAVTGSNCACWMKEPVTVRGQLDASIPRPIKNGWVVVSVTAPPINTKTGRALTRNWRASVDVAEDGSFVVPNLPSGTVEIMAGCDGFVSKDTSARIIPGVRQAQVVAEDDAHAVTIPMEPTGAVRVLVQTPDGQPLSGAMVGFSPNQMMGRGTNIVGTRTDSLDMLRRRDNDPGSLARFPSDFPRFNAKTDATGTVVIRDLPAGQQTLYVNAEGYDMPIEQNHSPLGPGQYWIPRRMATVTVNPAAEVSTQVKMEPKGSTSLSSMIQSVYPGAR